MNKKKLTVNRLAIGNLKTRKKQYTLMIIGILLAMIFSSGTLFFVSCFQSSREEQARRESGNFWGYFYQPKDYIDIEQGKKDGYIEQYGYGHIIGYGYTDEEKQEIDAMLETFVLNGTNFEGDKPLKPHDFSKSPDYYEAVSGVAEAYYEYDEVFDEVMWFVMGVFGIITLICPAAVIALIVIILKWRREKRLVKEYQGYFGTIEQARINANAQRMYYNGYNPYPQQPAPYGAYPQAQPVYYQPAPQQGDFHTNQTTVINGENQNQM